MLVFVRCTVRRTAPTSRIFSRVWRARRRRARFLALIGSSFLYLLLLRLFQHDAFVAIAHALALVGLGRAIGAHLGGDLADELLVDPADHDLGLGRRRDLDALGHLVHHRMREAERKRELVALRLRAEAHADEGEALLEALGDAGHHAGDERAHRSRHRVGVVRVAERLELDRLALFFDADVRIGWPGDGTERAFYRNGAASDVDFHALGQRNWVFGDSGHDAYATMQRTSPPTPSARALRSVMTPREVDRIATPSPFITRGISSRPRYTRSPGLETRSRRSITGRPA